MRQNALKVPLISLWLPWSFSPASAPVTNQCGFLGNASGGKRHKRSTGLYFTWHPINLDWWRFAFSLEAVSVVAQTSLAEMISKMAGQEVAILRRNRPGTKAEVHLAVLHVAINCMGLFCIWKKYYVSCVWWQNWDFFCYLEPVLSTTSDFRTYNGRVFSRLSVKNILLAPVNEVF